MFKKRHLLALAIASVLLLALGTNPGSVFATIANPQAQSGDSPGVTIPYSGQLTGDNGAPVADGLYDFAFAVYDAAEGGNLLWSETQTGVSVAGGSFAVTLGKVNPLPEIGKEAVLWLQVSVRGPKDQDYATLVPRQQLDAGAAAASSSASAAAVCTHNHLGEWWTGSSTGYTFVVENTSTGDGIRSYSNATAWNYGAFYGVNTGSGSGVYAKSTTGNGVRAISDSNDGINATTSATGMSGVYGHASNSFGVTGASTNTYGLQGRGNDASGEDQLGDLWLDGSRGEVRAGERLNLQSNGYVSIDIDQDANDAGSVFTIYKDNITEIFRVDQDGDVWKAGSVSAKVKTEDYQDRLLYAIESPENWFEDLGTAKLVDGVVTVTIDPMFAETVNLTDYDYHVFVTPLCDKAVVLFVSEKTPTGFTVQGVALDGQKSSCSFDYRIIALRLGYEDVRMAIPAMPEVETK